MQPRLPAIGEDPPAIGSRLASITVETIDATAATDVMPGSDTAPPASGIARRGRLSDGSRLANRYTITSQIGAGGMGEVYEAFDETTKRTVALKCLPRLDPSALLMFKREFRLLSDLYHPNLARLGELGSDGDIWFFTMERVYGEDFVDHARQHGEEALRRALKQLGEALAFLHDEGRVHRDIKPQNVLVEPSGRVVVLDFGLVRDSAGFDGLQSVTHTIRGTALYMAPEQALGKPAEPAADFYAVGTMLFEALVGRPPFVGSVLSVLVDKQMKEAPAASDAADGVADDLDLLCRALLRVEPGARAGAADIAALEIVLDTELELDANALLANAAAAPSSDRPNEHFQVAAGRARRSSDRAERRAEFVGRRTELDRLEAAFADSRTRAVTVMLEGESGVGKSALARRFAEDARARGALVLTGRCFDRENVPYKVLDGVVDSLARQLRRMSKSETAAYVPRQREAAAMLQTFPVLRTVDAFNRVPAPAFALDASEHRRMLFSAMRAMLERLGSRHPIVIVADDLQWADNDSHVALTELLLAAEAPPVLWVFTLRTGASSRFSLEGDVRTIPIGTLDSRDAVSLAASLGCAADAAETIARESGGHPLFLREMSMRTKSDGPARSLDETISERVAALHPDARTLVEVVALAGCPLPADVALVAAGLADESASRAIAITRAEFLLRAGEGTAEGAIEPYHDRVRESVVGRLDGAARTALHRALAEAMHGTELSLRRPDVHARHLRAAGDGLGASDAYVRAGRNAARATAFDAAAAAFREAIALARRPTDEHADLLEELGETLANAGRPFEASAALLEAAETGRLADAMRRRRRAGLALLDTGNLDGAKAILGPILEAGGERWPRIDVWFWILLAFELIRTPWVRWRARRAPFARSNQGDDAGADLMIDISLRLSITDHMVSHWFALRAMRAALRADDPVVLGRAASMLHAVTATIGFVDSDWDAIAARCERSVGADEWTQGWRAFGTQLALFFAGSLAASMVHGARFEDHARRTTNNRLATERLLSNFIMCWAGTQIGQFDRAPAIRAAAREAERRRDPLAFVFMAEQCFFVWLMIGDVKGLASVLRESARMVPLRDAGLRDYLRLTAELQVGLIERAHDPAPTWASMQRQLDSILKWTTSAKITAPRNAMLGLVHAMRTGGDETRWIAAASTLGYRLADHPNPLVRFGASEARAAVALATRDRARVIAALRESLAIARLAEFHALAHIDAHRLGRFLGNAEGDELVTEAERELVASGLRDPRLFAMLWSPLPDDDFTPYRASIYSAPASGYTSLPEDFFEVGPAPKA